MDILIEFDELPWESPAPGIRYKAFVRGSQQLRLLEFSPGFEEKEWCTKGHAAYVLDGSLTLKLEGREVRMKAGDVGFLAPGKKHQHKAVLGRDESARLLLFEVL